jgi:hypothetical protein
MRYKAVFVMGLSAGYVLGARAGRQRYEQIKRMSKSISSNPAVRHTTDTAQAQAMHLGERARRAAQEKAGAMGHDLMEKMQNKLPGKIPAGISNRMGHREINLDAESVPSNGTMT